MPVHVMKICVYIHLAEERKVLIYDVTFIEIRSPISSAVQKPSKQTKNLLAP